MQIYIKYILLLMFNKKIIISIINGELSISLYGYINLKIK